MVSQKGAHDIWKAELGAELEPMEVTLNEQLVGKRLWANDTYNPWYMEDSPFGGRIVPPTMLSLVQIPMIWGFYTMPPGGSVNARQELDFIHPVMMGARIRVTGKLVGKYERKGRTLFTFEFSARDENGTEVVHMKRTVATPANVPEER